MFSRGSFLVDLLAILSAGIIAVVGSSILLAIVLKIYRGFYGSFEKKVVSDVKQNSLESWESNES